MVPVANNILTHRVAIGDASLLMEVRQSTVRAAIKKKIISPEKFAGRFAMFPVSELPNYRAAMERAGMVAPKAK